MSELMRYVFVVILFFMTLNLSAQTKEWKTETSDDGKTEVVYAIYDSVNSAGEEVKFIEYSAKSNTTASLEKCVEIFNNPNMHKKFYEYTEVSEKLKDISENE